MDASGMDASGYRKLGGYRVLTLALDETAWTGHNDVPP